MKKDTLINLYWILDAVQKGAAPDATSVRDCFVAVRDELLQPDTEEIVVHIRGVLEQSQAAADVLTNQLIGSARKGRGRPLPAQRLVRMMASVPPATADEVAVAFGRLVEAAHGIED